MGVISQDKTKKLLWFYLYVFVSGLSSLLLSLLTNCSLLVNRKKAKTDHQVPIKTKQSIFKSDKEFVKLRFLKHLSKQEFPIHLDLVKLDINKLRKTPKSLRLKQQNIFKGKIENPDNLFNSQVNLRQKLESSNQKITRFHHHIPLLREIPDKYEFLVKGLESLIAEFSCDKIIDLGKSS